MSSASQFFGGGSTPLGGYALFNSNEPNTVTLPDGKIFLKSGVLARSADYPTVPAAFTGFLNPLTPVAEIGSGGCWSSIVMDPGTGFPLILSDHSGGGLVMMGAAGTTRTGDVTLATGYSASMSGSGFNGLRFRKAVVHKGRIAVSIDATLSAYAGSASVWSSCIPPTLIWSGNGTLLPAAQRVGCFASNPSGNMIAISDVTGTSAWYAATATTAATAATMPASAAWRGATWNATNALFIAVASGGTQAASSTDGVTWTSRTLPASASWSAVAASNGARSVAVASGGTAAAYSDNGTTWTSATLPASANWSAVAHNGSLWCAVARDSTIAATSADGITWTQRTLPASAGWADVQWCAALSVWVAVADDGKAAAAYSANGITWTAKPLPFLMTQFNNMVSGGGTTLYALEDNIYANGMFTVAKSTDSGATWTYYKPNVKIGWGSSGPDSAIRYVNGGLTALWADNASSSLIYISRSTDGITWTNTTPSTPAVYTNFRDIAWNGTNYVVVFENVAGTASNRCITSPNLTTWTERTFTGSSNLSWYNVISVGTNFLALGGSSSPDYAISRSTDSGVTWTQVNNGGGAGGIANPQGFLQYDSVRNVVGFVSNGSDNLSKVSFDQGATWSLSNVFHGPSISNITAGGGSTWTVATTTTVQVFGSRFGTSVVANYTYNYSHGYSLKRNMGKVIGNGSTVAANVQLGGVPYYLDGQNLLRMDTALYIDNSRVASEASSSSTYSQLNYYMRVK